MLSDNSCNGWTNYPTWIAKCWLDQINDESKLINHWLDEINQLENDSDVLDDKAFKIYHLSQAIKTYLEDYQPLADQANLWNDLIRYAIESVNTRELAKDYLEDQ